jgi:hypothetical protein
MELDKKGSIEECRSRCYTKPSTLEQIGDTKLLNLFGKCYSPERCFEFLDGSGVGVDIIQCTDYVTLGRMLYGKRMLNVTVTYWIYDMNHYIFWWELFEEYPKWFLKQYLSKIWTEDIDFWYDKFNGVKEKGVVN